jgi:methionyl-tRNA formyltransferase
MTISVIFCGTPELSASVLRDLIATPDISVRAIITNPDKPVGRSGDLMPTPVKKVWIEHNIPVFTPLRIRENIELFDTLRSLHCDYLIVVAYGRILPLEFLEIPQKKSINIHGSILPKYRGASPIQSALLHWETETGVTIMEMSEGMDEGDILKIRIIPIAPDETSETLFAKFADISGPTLIQTLRELEMGGITPLLQDHTLATYCKKIEKEDGLIDWSRSAREIYQMWQAYTPWPGIYTIYEERRLLLEEVSLYRHSDEGRIQNSVRSEDESFLPQDDQSSGQIIKLEDGNIWVICGGWILTLSQLKLEWKKSSSAIQFERWREKFIWTIL